MTEHQTPTRFDGPNTTARRERDERLDEAVIEFQCLVDVAARRNKAASADQGFGGGHVGEGATHRPCAFRKSLRSS